MAEFILAIVVLSLLGLLLIGLAVNKAPEQTRPGQYGSSTDDEGWMDYDTGEGA